MADRTLRTIGWVCPTGVLVGMPSVFALLLMDGGQWTLWAGGILGASLLVHYVVMSLHLAASRTLPEGEKVKWESFGGGLGFIAAFAYLLRHDRCLLHYKAGRS